MSVASRKGSLGSDAQVEEVTEAELLDIWGLLERYGIEERIKFTKVVSSKKLYHFDSLERLEKTVI